MLKGIDMERLHIAAKPNPTEALLEIRRAIFDFCDEDIGQAFQPHGFTVEPLLMQIIRELQELRRLWSEPDGVTPASDVRAPGDAATGDHPVDYGESATETPTPDDFGRPSRGGHR
jgi:hypothetical protein